MDLWVTLFVLSFAASELLREASPEVALPRRLSDPQLFCIYRRQTAS